MKDRQMSTGEQVWLLPSLGASRLSHGNQGSELRGPHVPVTWYLWGPDTMPPTGYGALCLMSAIFEGARLEPECADPRALPLGDRAIGVGWGGAGETWGSPRWWLADGRGRGGLAGHVAIPREGPFPAVSRGQDP
ncbi:hypothetical protein H1C71_018898 [Ictidomys tridecemlineatus]|nr:hypothetical protein H1C71_018898 [Ictidomys tridecemlineatus]